MKWFIYVIKIYMHNLILWWRNHLIAIQHLLLCKQSLHPSTAFQTSMSPFIYHILLPLTDLSLIYSCRLHGQSICHATRSINLHTGCIPRDREICPACSAIEEPAYQLHNWSTHIPAACSVMKEPAYLLATQLANLHISCMFRDGDSAYQLHTSRSGNLSISHAIDQSIS